MKTKEEFIQFLEEHIYPTIDIIYLDYESCVRTIFDHVDFFFEDREGDYQGDWYMIGRNRIEKDEWYFISMSFGSCSGCDLFQYSIEEGKEGMMDFYEQMISCMKVMTLSELRDYVKKHDFHSEYKNNDGVLFYEAMVKAIDKELTKT